MAFRWIHGLSLLQQVTYSPPVLSPMNEKRSVRPGQELDLEDEECGAQRMPIRSGARSQTHQRFSILCKGLFNSGALTWGCNGPFWLFSLYFFRKPEGFVWDVVGFLAVFSPHNCELT